jgi:hypothetical protein
MEKYLGGPDPGGAKAATEALMTMSKIDLGELQRAYDAGSSS